MAELKIKAEHADRRVVFGNSGNTKISERSQEDLAKLALIAQQSKDKSLLELFEGELPSVEELQQAETKTAVSKGPQPEAPVDQRRGPRAAQVNQPPA